MTPRQGSGSTTRPLVPSGWTGRWVAEALGARLDTTDDALGIAPADLVGLALRRNPRRAQLIVSRVLGKHVPADPHLVYGSGLLLGELVRRALTGDPALPYGAVAALRAALDEDGAAAPGSRDLPSVVRLAQPDPRADVVLGYPHATVLGYAETATGLGHAVADALRTARYVHSTRRQVPGIDPVGGFDEEHSHAPGHLLLPADPQLLSGGEPLVLVDDELSTGLTVLNTIAVLHRHSPRARYVVATLLDLRSINDHHRLTRAAEVLGTRIDVVALSRGHLTLPADAPARGVALVAELASADAAVAVPAPATAPLTRVDVAWPAGLALGARHGYGPAERVVLEAALPSMAQRLAAALWPPGAAHSVGRESVLVLGTEELMYAPTRLAGALADLTRVQGIEAEVLVSSTTRSPVAAHDTPGYAIRSALSFPSHDNPADGAGPRFAYNLTAPGGVRRFDAIVVVLDPSADSRPLHEGQGLIAALRGLTGQVLLVTLPETPPVRPRRERASALPEPLRGPDFGSYAASEVGWLLTDLSDVELEAPLVDREAAVQSGRAHYAESLPIEYTPGPEYLELYDAALERSAERVAHAVGLVTEAVLARRGARTVLVSLARAGTPVGILMRRWAAQTTGLRLPHYAISIVRGRGIDPVALRWLAANHDPRDVVFVDGWTGKGAIAAELTAALEAHVAAGGPRFGSDLAVLADPGCAAPMAGTREDFLVPSACLNSTVSGLVSRTVLRSDLIGPDDFHGAKFYAELAHADRSADFLDAVSAQFARVARTVAVGASLGVALARPVTWSGRRAVERIAAVEGIVDLNLIKPGVGETTRVLLRRIPHKVLVCSPAPADGAGDDLAHIRVLAAERGVPVEVVPDLAYSCVGIIATHTDGAGSVGDA
ncbi:MAG: phosphoribosyltransferase [Sporichthyaceae bacterium]